MKITIHTALGSRFTMPLSLVGASKLSSSVSERSLLHKRNALINGRKSEHSISCSPLFDLLCYSALAFLVAILLPYTASAADVIPLSKPVGESIKPNGIYWKFDHGKIGKADPNPTADDSGNGFDGFLLSSESGVWPEYVEGKFGTAIRFRGGHPTENDPRVVWDAKESQASDTSKLDMAEQSFTVGAWVKFDTIKSGESQTFVVFERGFTTGENSAWQLAIIKPPNDKWRLRVHLPGLYQDAAGESINFSDGEWHHVAFSLQVAGDGSTLFFWFDGVRQQDGLSVNTVISPVAGDNQGRVFTVGERSLHYHFSDADASVDDVFVTTGLYEFSN